MKIKHGFVGERFLLVPYRCLLSMSKNRLTGDIYIHSMGYFSHATHHFIDRPKGRNEYIFIYCKSGSGWVIVNGKKYILNENYFIIINPGEPHSYGADPEDPWTIYWIHFIGKKAALFSDGFNIPTLVTLDNSSRIKDRLDLFEEMYSVLSHGFTPDYLNYANLCLVHFLGTFIFVKQYREVQEKAEYSSNAIDMVVYYMHEKISEKLTVKEMASYSGYSESYFHLIFVRETGYSPIEYFNRMKIEKACEYLTYSNMKIVQIAHLLGFTDPYYFTRTFTGIKGMSPLKYRREQLKAEN